MFSVWVARALTFLVISCPCALVISIPLSFFGGIGGASKRGILVKGSNYLEALAQTETVVFDKTGTLTRGTFQVTAVHPPGFPGNSYWNWRRWQRVFRTIPSPVRSKKPMAVNWTTPASAMWKKYPATVYAPVWMEEPFVPETVS